MRTSRGGSVVQTRQRHDSKQARRQARRGFSLTELIFVMLIVGIVASIAIPRIDFNRARVNSNALSMTTRLMAAQRLSVLRQHNVRLSFDVDAGTVTSHEDRDNDGSRDPDETLTQWALEEGVVFGLSGAPGMGAQQTAIAFEPDADGLPTMSFHRNGSTSEEGFIYLTSKSGSETHARALRVRRSTGHTECWSYRTLTWERGC
jgi:prepilin-type N-terminal cleavage/methylation domain-containing protein